MEIIDFEVEANDSRYILRVSFDGNVSYEWQQAYHRAIGQTGFISIRFSGAPTIDKFFFTNNFAISNPFPKLAVKEIPEVMEELKKMVSRANLLYENMQAEKEEEEERLKNEQNDKLKAINDFIHKKPENKKFDFGF